MSEFLIPISPEENPRPGNRLRMASLSPRFDEDKHQLYYDLLTRAIDHKDTRNIALTGAYGTGKSSILDQLRTDRETRVVELSLSTTATDSQETDEPADRLNAYEESRTNLIQKEIVKQLLYRLPTYQVPRSRFHRTSTPAIKRSWLQALLWGVPSFLVLLGLGLIQPVIGYLFPDSIWRQMIAFLLLAGLCVGAAWLVRRVVVGRIAISASVSTGPATVTLSKNSETYFDKYLDEIVYFFQASKADVVVIEDIDRFEDIQVFDTLRALNGLLNSSKTLTRIVFIYAIRDSVFEQIGETTPLIPGNRPPSPVGTKDRAKEALERASRTKFFDVIIPVVPFVSANNARDVMSNAMESDEFAIDPALIRLAARHVADMRLIHNIRNEFEVYRNRLVLPTARVHGITDDLVFAIVLFKNTHLGDFENIRHQDSTLDHLYREWRRIVRENLTAAARKLVTLRSSSHLEHMADERAKSLGDRLSVVTANLQTALNSIPGSRASVALRGPATDENAHSREIWESIASGQNQQLHISHPSNIYSNQVEGASLSFTVENLSDLLGVRIDAEEWKQRDLALLEAEIDRCESMIDFLRHSTWDALSKRNDILFSGPAMKNEPQKAPLKINFDTLVERTLDSDLARDLVRHGFLTHNFALYSSHYYGNHLGPAAMEYVRRCVEPGEPDFTFDLDQTAIDQILREQNADKTEKADFFSDPSAYNISIVDYLLKERPQAANQVAERLARQGSLESEFLAIYTPQGMYPGLLMTAITPFWPGALRYATIQAPVAPDTRLTMVDAVLSKVTSTELIAPEKAVSDYLRDNYQNLHEVTDPNSLIRANIVLSIMHAGDVVLESLLSLNPLARTIAVRRAMYSMTTENMATLAPGDSIALDVFRGPDDTMNLVYEHAIRCLSDYLDAVEDSSTTPSPVEDPAELASIINDAAKVQPVPLLDRLIGASGDDCRVPNLGSVSRLAWPSLAARNRTDPTFVNIKSYIDELGIDTSLVALLTTHRQIIEAEGGDRTDLLEVAVELIAAQSVIPSTTLRVELAASIAPGLLPADRIEPEDNDLVARLLKAKLLADEPSAFSPRLMVSWSVLEAAIATSENFAAFVSPDVLAPAHLPQLFRSQRIPNEVKDSVLDSLADYLSAPGASTAHVRALTSTLIDDGWRVSYLLLEQLQKADATNLQIVRLAANENEELSIDNLKSLFRAMGGPYARVADGGQGRPTFPSDDAHKSVLGRFVGETISKAEVLVTKARGLELVTPLLQSKN